MCLLHGLDLKGQQSEFLCYKWACCSGTIWIFGNTYYHLDGYELFLYWLESCLLCVLLCPGVGTGAMGAAEGSYTRLVAVVAGVCLLFMINKMQNAPSSPMKSFHSSSLGTEVPTTTSRFLGVRKHTKTTTL